MNRASSTAELARRTAWPLDRIKDHSSKIGSGITPKGGATSYLNAGVPLLRSQNVHFDGLRLDDVAFIGEDTHAEMAGTQLKAGDVLLNITGASIGRCTFIPEGFGEGNVNQHVCIIRPSASLDHRFLTYCLAAPWGQDQILSSFTGASRQGLGQRDLGEIQIPLPTRPDQERIVAYLDASCAAIDAAVAAKRRQLETLDSLRTTIITRAVTRGLDVSVELKDSGVAWIGHLPLHWKVEKLKYVTSLIVDGTHFTPTYLPDGVPFLRVTDVQEKEIDLERVKYISEEEHQLLCKRAKAEYGDILLSKNGTIGVVKVVNWAWEFSFFVSLCLLRPLKNLNAHYFSYYFDSDLVDQQLFESSKRTSVTNLHLIKIRELLIALPPIDEQEKIILYLDAKCAELVRLKKNITDQITKLENYRRSLIHECVTGQRRVTEADIKRVQAHG